jgi:hypothetical protein
MGRRIFTNIAIAGIISVVLAVAAMWIVAASDGHVQLIVREYQTPPEFRGNHGPWRHARVLNSLYDFAMFATLFGVLPAAWVGAMTERTRRAGVVAGLATLMLFLNCAHFPLFD